MDNPILIHAQQIDSQAFGDPRLVKMGRRYMQQSANIKRYKKVLDGAENGASVWLL